MIGATKLFDCASRTYLLSMNTYLRHRNQTVLDKRQRRSSWRDARSVYWLLCACLVLAHIVFAAAANSSAAPTDSLVKTGRMHLSNKRAEGARAAFEDALRHDPSHAYATAGLGRALLLTGDTDSAETLFLRADSLEPSFGHLPYGRGLIELQAGNTDAAEDYFDKAVKRNRNNADAQVSLARIQRGKIAGHIRAERTLDRALRAERNHPEAYYELGLIREETNRLDAAVEEYERQISVNPHHGESMIRLGYIFLQTGRPWHSRQRFMDALTHTPGRELELTLALAATYVTDRQFDIAHQYYVQALQMMPAEERAYYEDISRVGTAREARYVRQASDEERRKFLERFWLSRDPTPVTNVNERLLENFRRVWYARMHFSTGATPWDRRGDVYVRYGEPDHRSTYQNPNFTTSREVRQVRERYLHQIYGPAAPEGLASSHMPVYPLIDPVEYTSDGSQRSFGTDETFSYDPRRARQGSYGEDSQTGATFGREPVFPMSESRATLIRWEVWTYTNLAGGVQFTFVDNIGRGTYSFAQPPETSDFGMVNALHQYAPSEKFNLVLEHATDQYEYEHTQRPLDFFYYTAQFRTPDDKTQLDVYYGIPVGDLTFREMQGEFVAEVESGIAIFDSLWNVRGRSADRMQLVADRRPGPSLGAIQMDMRSVDLAGGQQILLSVQAKDMRSGRIRAFQDNIDILRYDTTRLAVSDVVLANTIRTVDDGDTGKFIRNGLYILPMAGLGFTRDTPLHVYFEIYNLTRGEDYGETEYEVEYAIRSHGSEPGSILSSVGRILGGTGRRVGVGQVIEGFRAAEFQRFRIDTDTLEPGRYTLIVTVSDLKSDQRVTRQRDFTIYDSE